MKDGSKARIIAAVSFGLYTLVAIDSLRGASTLMKLLGLASTVLIAVGLLVRSTITLEAGCVAAALEAFIELTDQPRWPLLYFLTIVAYILIFFAARNRAKAKQLCLLSAAATLIGHLYFVIRAQSAYYAVNFHSSVYLIPLLIIIGTIAAGIALEKTDDTTQSRPIE